jgi:ribosomal protein L37E
VYCDKCGSKNIEIKIERTASFAPSPRKMSEYNPTYAEPAVYRPFTYHMRCRECGFKVDITR